MSEEPETTYAVRLVRGETYIVGERKFVVGREYEVDRAMAAYLTGNPSFEVTAIPAEPVAATGSA